MTDRELIEELVEALDKLLRLTKFELSHADNLHRQPWVRNIERCATALEHAKEHMG